MQHVIVFIIVLVIILYFAFLVRRRLRGRDGGCNCEGSGRLCEMDNSTNNDGNYICGSMMDSCGDCPLRQQRFMKKEKE